MSDEPVNELKQLAESFRRDGVGEPTDTIDAAVRASARAAARRRRASAWTLPAALAATALIAFSLVVQVQHDAGVPTEDAASPAEEPSDARILREAAPSLPAPPPPAAAMAPPTADQAAEKAATSIVAPAAMRQSGALHDEGADTPERWLERIEALEAAGRREEAAAERQRLEAAYPGWLAQQATQRD